MEFQIANVGMEGVLNVCFAILNVQFVLMEKQMGTRKVPSMVHHQERVWTPQ